MSHDRMGEFGFGQVVLLTQVGVLVTATVSASGLAPFRDGPMDTGGASRGSVVVVFGRFTITDGIHAATLAVPKET